MSNIKVRNIKVDGNVTYIASTKYDGDIIEAQSYDEASAIAELEEELRYRTQSSFNPNQGMSFDEDEEDYYS